MFWSGGGGGRRVIGGRGGGELGHGRFQKIFTIIQLILQHVVTYVLANMDPVLYTHLTLPTNREVEISVVAVSLKKKKNLTKR